MISSLVSFIVFRFSQLAVCFDCGDDLLGGLVVRAAYDGFNNVDYLCSRGLLFLEILDDALAFYEEYAERADDGAVGDGVPGKGKTEEVYQHAEDHHAQVVQDLRHRAAERLAPDLFLVLPGGVYAGPEVNEAGDDDEHAAQEDDRDAVAYVLGQVQV